MSLRCGQNVPACARQAADVANASPKSTHKLVIFMVHKRNAIVDRIWGECSKVCEAVSFDWLSVGAFQVTSAVAFAGGLDWFC